MNSMCSYSDKYFYFVPTRQAKSTNRGPGIASPAVLKVTRRHLSRLGVQSSPATHISLRVAMKCDGGSAAIRKVLRQYLLTSPRSADRDAD